MDIIIKKRLLKCICDMSQVKNEAKMKSIYEEFIKHLDSVTKISSSYLDIIRVLEYVRIELLTSDVVLLYEAGKKYTK